MSVQCHLATQATSGAYASYLQWKRVGNNTYIHPTLKTLFGWLTNEKPALQRCVMVKGSKLFIMCW